MGARYGGIGWSIRPIRESYKNACRPCLVYEHFIKNGRPGSKPASSSGAKAAVFGYCFWTRATKRPFQASLWKEGNALGQAFQIIAGTANQPNNKAISATGSLLPHLAGPELAKAIQNATYIISRGGYTSLMELIPFKKRLILIPTPGQTEQEYLAKRWQEKGWAIAFDQTNFKLATALEAAADFNYQPIPFKSFTKEALKATLKQVNL